ncbi:Esterase OVCA2 [Porphyridium purpureum]|uniref:Esterase OVCA2 n=1 Tax=Porphyridium purpureum TaxID=35688 RepID=A0A5J4YT09_PORPP|nr:Esterase OVCA2 [Porphyridium purpureum]|eukprot:POR5731..scf227_4
MAVCLRVLMLHGFRQNAAVFRRRTGAFRKAVAKQLKEKDMSIEFVFLDAPLVVTSDHEAVAEESKQRSWWDANALSVDSDSSNGDETQAFRYAHWEETVKYIKVFCSSQSAAFDGVVGFSQGACVTALLSALAAQRSEGELQWLKFGILISAFPPRDPVLRMALYDQAQPIPIPCLHIWGEQDEIIRPSYSRLVMGAFEPQMQASYTHPGGHVVPSSKEVGAAVEEFLSAIRFRSRNDPARM